MQAPYHPPSADISFVAHDGRPVLLLEDFDHLLDNVSCSERSDSDTGVLELVFGDEEAFAVALQTWTDLSTFTLITSHPTCNPDNDRGAWM